MKSAFHFPSTLEKYCTKSSDLEELDVGNFTLARVHFLLYNNKFRQLIFLSVVECLLEWCPVSYSVKNIFPEITFFYAFFSNLD